MSNGNSFGNGASVCLGSLDDPRVRMLPAVFRWQVPMVRTGGWGR